MGARKPVLRVRTVVGICVCIGTIDASLFGLMAVWDIPIDVASFICLVTAIGLSVDYVVHLAHAFEHAEHAPHGSGAGLQRVSAMFEDIGASVVKGGTSTFLGIVVLAFTKSAVFRLFFKMLFGIVVLGMFGGIVVFPATMSLCAKRRKHRGDSRVTSAVVTAVEVVTADQSSASEARV